MPGVLGIVTNKDFPISKNKSEKYLRNNSLADNKVLYVGHAIAGVAAINPHIAEEAIDLIDVKYEVLPPVLTAPDGASVDSPKLHKDLRTDMFGEQQEGETTVVFPLVPVIEMISWLYKDLNISISVTISILLSLIAWIISWPESKPGLITTWFIDSRIFFGNSAK